MKTEQPKLKNRDGERGAALVMVLLVSFLLLVVSAGLILETTMNTANVTDAVAEQQAYYAAESGIQSTINVLRRNTVPSPLINASKPSSDSDNKIDYARAITLSSSNKSDDPSADARLSRWLNYNYTPDGGTYPDRVTLGSEPYNPQTGTAFAVTVTDPDNPNKIIDITTTGTIGTGGTDTKTYGIPFINGTTLKFTGVNSAISVSSREVGVNLGTLTVTKNGIGNTTITDTPFEILVKMNAPLPAAVKIRGTIKGGTVTGASVGSTHIELDSPATSLLGSIITVPSTSIPLKIGVTNIGTDLGLTITLSQPRRLVIRSVGFGPRGARKVLEAVVQRNNFDGLLPATVTLVGDVTGSIFRSSTSSSQQVSYSGNDVLSNAKIPPIGTITSGTSSGGLLSGVLNNLTGILCSGCTVDGNPADIGSDETPEFLKSTANLDKAIKDYMETAKSLDRYYSGTDVPPNFGNNADGTGITFIDGDAKLTGAGGGILIVTGKLTLDQAFDFNGTIIVTGKDGVDRHGGGTGNIQGNLVVAPYKVNDLAAGFLPPKYDVTGGAVSNLIYRTTNLLFGSDNFNTVVVGVVEK